MTYDFVAIDFETANSNMNSACSMGLAFVKNNKIVDSKYFLIQPPDMHFDTNNILIHNITPEMVTNAPTFDYIWNKVYPLIQDSLLIAHNARFDMSVIKCCLMHYNIPIPEIHYACSIPISTKACHGISNKLVDRAAALSVEIKNHHNALDDAKVCAQIVINTITMLHRKSIHTFLSTYSSIVIRDLVSLKPQTTFGKKEPKFKKHISISEIAASIDSIEIDKSHVFYGKSFIFTGELPTVNRKIAMEKVVSNGGILKSTVNSKLDYLVLGIQDLSIVGSDGMSTKERKAKQLISEGANIKILNEQDFLKML